jgi:hypothetical protein
MVVSYEKSRRSGTVRVHSRERAPRSGDKKNFAKHDVVEAVQINCIYAVHTYQLNHLIYSIVNDCLWSKYGHSTPTKRTLEFVR